MKKGISKGAQLFKNQPEIIQNTYEEAFEEYIVSAKIRGLSEETIRTYKHHHNYFADFIGTNTNCSNITEKTIESYINYLKDKNIKGTSVNSYVLNISPIIKYCIKC